MANNKDKQEDEKAIFFARDIDPELQHKVDEYMNPDVVVEAETPHAPPKFESASTQDTVSAPLLPTDKLPDLEGKKTKPKEVEVDLHTKSEEPEQRAEVEPEHTQTDTGLTSIETDKEELKDDLGLEDAQTAHAVDEIIASEADELMNVQDQKLRAQNDEPKKQHTPKIKAFFSAWWHKKIYRNTTFAIILIAIIGCAVTPTSRYYVLNAAGVRASASVVVLDDKTGLPLKNVEFTIDNQTSKTDSEGQAKVEKIELGNQTMVIKKPAFAEIDRTITIGWGSNPLGETRIVPVGIQYSFALSDFLSNKPIAKAEATSGEASALSNDKGEIILTVPQTDQEQIEVVIAASDYRKETTKVSSASKQSQKILMSPAKKHAFISKRSGTLDLYKIDVDGKNEEKVLSGTGREKQDTMALALHAKKNIAALVSVRDNNKNKDGFLLSTLNIVNLDTNEVTKVADSERIQIVDWVGDRLVYVKITQGASEANLDRHKLMSYDLGTESSKELASTNYFNDVLVARGVVYYSPAIYKVNGAVGLFKINPDGSNKKTIYDKEVWNLYRTDYDKVSASVGQDWYDLTLSTDGFTKSSGALAVLKSRIYVDSPNTQKSLWVDERDGKGVLVLYDTQSKQEKTVQTQGGLKNPVLWSDNTHVVYRIANGQETADYVLNLDGGEPKKVRDVTNVAGVDRWYYY